MQQAQNLRAVHRGGQGADQLDALVLSLLRRQCCYVLDSRADLYPRQFLRTLATPEPAKDRLQKTLKEKLIKIDAKILNHGRYIIFQMAEVAIRRDLFVDILRMIAELRGHPWRQRLNAFMVKSSNQTTGEGGSDDSQFCDFTGRKARPGRPSAILRSGEAFRDGCTLSKAANPGEAASEPGGLSGEPRSAFLRTDTYLQNIDPPPR